MVQDTVFGNVFISFYILDEGPWTKDNVKWTKKILGYMLGSLKKISFIVEDK